MILSAPLFITVLTSSLGFSPTPAPLYPTETHSHNTLCLEMSPFSSGLLKFDVFFLDVTITAISLVIIFVGLCLY